MQKASVVVSKSLTGERINAQHLNFLQELFANEQVAATLWPNGLGGPRTSLQTKEILRSEMVHWEQHDFGVWVFRNRADNQYVGRGGLRKTTVNDCDEVEVTYALLPEYWNEGFATEIAQVSIQAALHLKIEEVVCFTSVTNIPSQKVMQKAGFHYEKNITRVGLPHVLYRVRPEDISVL
jgi:RimJ/RimL family protein N-acetyltransferase